MIDHQAWTKPAFWRALAPDMHIEDEAFQAAVPVFQVPPQIGETLPFRVRHEGYFELMPRQWGVPLERMAGLVGDLAARGMPPPFAFVYDEFWLMFRQVSGIIGTVLGEDFRRLPDFWVWHVDPAKGESGWKPHRDRDHTALFADRSPKSLSVWIPLTEATPLNSCMYLVPADRDPTYGHSNDTEWNFELTDVRALPGKPGTVFAWSQAVLHWGSHAADRKLPPRISASVEFQSGAVEPFNQPLSDPQSVPPFTERLRLIGKQILQYRHMYPLDDQLAALAQQLRDGVEPC